MNTKQYRKYSRIDNMSRHLVALISVVIATNILIGATCYADAGVYNDSEFNVSFTVPEGWTESDIGIETIDVQYMHDDMSGDNFSYTSEDLWSQMTDEEKQLYGSRSDVDLGIMAPQDVEAMFMGYTTVVTTETHGSFDYYRADVDMSMDIASESYSLKGLGFVLIHDGVMYLFFFTSADPDNHLVEYIKIVDSAEYDTVSSQTSSDYLSETSSEIESESADNSAVDSAVSDTYSDASSEGDILAGETVLDNQLKYLSALTGLSEKYLIKLVTGVAAAFAFFGLLIVMLIPILIYRFAIRRTRISSRSSLLTASIYSAAVALPVILLLMLSDFESAIGYAMIMATLVSGIITYFILAKGRAKSDTISN